MDIDQRIENHYNRPDLFDTIKNQLVVMGVDIDYVTRFDIAKVDEFHVRGAAVSREMAASIELEGAHVLDVGCGLGGPCRMLADEFGCIVTGVDLNREYIKTASALSTLVRLEAQTKFIRANALDLPFPSESFDVVWTQHAQMNIADKNSFYSEMQRVLKPEGHLLYYDIFKRGAKKVMYPMPWADNAELSFLFSVGELERLLSGIHFKEVARTDQTEAGIAFFQKMIARLDADGPPKMGLNLLMGESTRTKISNLLRGLESETLSLQSGIYVKKEQV